MTGEKIWNNKYNLNKQVEAYTVDNDFRLDLNLVKYDCRGSIAHAKMLGKIGVLKKQEVDKLVKELNNIINLHESGKFTIKKEQEDCHTAIEQHLIKKLGDLGKKIHTGRSRNDQVLTALRLYYKDELASSIILIKQLVKSISGFIKKYGKIKFPGYTHTRKAMPSSIALWGNAFIDSMADNQKLAEFTLAIIDQSPLGTGAGYNVPLNLDRTYTAKLLNFRKVQQNSIYVQNSRMKFEILLLNYLSTVMLDLNKIATDLVMFSMPEFGYFELPEEICTGSSIMPQKKNPDVLELLRAKYHVVCSFEFQIKSIAGNLISGYHRDYQLTKEPVMNSFKITEQSLSISTLIFNKLKVNKENCNKGLSKEVYATEEVYNLVKKGVPFREAYKKISKKY